MDKLSIFNNEELLEVYDKINQELSHLNECIIVEEDETEVEVPEDNTETNEEVKEEKEEENNEQS